FHIVSQIGYMILGLGLFSLAGIAGAIFYIVHHIIVKTSLFLAGGMVEHTTGTAALTKLSGLMHRAPVMAVLFALPALSLAGLPPMSGFVAKVALVEAGLDAQRLLIVAVSLVVSLLTLFSMAKIWAGMFWGEPDHPGAPGPRRPAEGKRVQDPGFRLHAPWPMTAATSALVVVSLAVAVAGYLRWHGAERAVHRGEALPPLRIPLLVAVGLVVASLAALIVVIVGR
ncbi:MAG: hypothetical protein GEU89_21220, partial [Kiloniellaceae bacterium]|nr:hypothetical protein [Kiloniellaceae bacterium]